MNPLVMPRQLSRRQGKIGWEVWDLEGCAVETLCGWALYGQRELQDQLIPAIDCRNPMPLIPIPKP